MLSAKELKIVQAQIDMYERGRAEMEKELRMLRFRTDLAIQHNNEQSEIEDYKYEAKLAYEELDKIQTSYFTIINLMSDLGYCIDENNQLVKSIKDK